MNDEARVFRAIFEAYASFTSIHGVRARVFQSVSCLVVKSFFLVRETTIGETMEVTLETQTDSREKKKTAFLSLCEIHSDRMSRRERERER